MIDVTDATFEQDVLVRSEQVPVVVDLWAPWCGPCRTLGPILEKVIEAKGGSVELVKVNVDENPRISTTFQVQSIPAVFALRDRQVVDGFIGAVPEPQVQRIRGPPRTLSRRRPTRWWPPVTRRRCVVPWSSSPGTPVPSWPWPACSSSTASPTEALHLLARIPETPDVRQVAAEARLAAQRVEVPADGVDVLLDSLLTKVKADEGARQEFLDLLETLGPDDPRTAQYRKALAARLF